MMATTVAEIGSVYCSVVSFANTRGSYEMERGPIVQSLIAIRLKLKRSLVLRANIVYEVSRVFHRVLLAMKNASYICLA